MAPSNERRQTRHVHADSSFHNATDGNSLVHSNAEGPTPSGLEPSLPAQSMPTLKTYIVEDSPVIRENLVATLEELLPLEVVGTAADESTAVQWLAQADHACDLVIVDIFLKGGSGLGVLRAARAMAQRRKLVVLSNYATQDMRAKCMELGADKVFDKSNDIDVLIQYCSRLATGLGGDPAASGHGPLA
jgi:CheY-like chemotaxis protein